MRMLPFLLLAAACKPDAPVDSGPPESSPIEAADPYQAAAARLFRKDHLVEIELEMDPVDAASLGAETNDLFELLNGADCIDTPWKGPFNWYPADIRVDGGPWYRDVGLRKKGLIGSMSTEKPSLKVDFDTFVDGQSLDGIERLTLNNAISDPALISQCLGYQLFADAGLPAARCNFAHVVANGEDLGIYVNVEPYKKDFLRASFPGGNDGDLYEGTLSDFRDGWTNTFDIETGSTDPERGPILDVVAALAIADDEAMLDALDQVLDVDAFLDFWAMEVLVGHIDGYAGNTNNFYVYRPEDSDRMVFLPWGIDYIFHDTESFGSSTVQVTMANTALTRRLWSIPSMRAAYLDRLSLLLDTVWDEPSILAEVDRMAALVEPVALPDDNRAAAQEGVRDFVRNRRANAEYLMSQPMPEFTEPLRVGICLVEAGTLRMDFDAVWGTLESADPLNEGAATLTGSIEGVPFDFQGGAIAGETEGVMAVAGIGLSGPTTATYALAQTPSWNFHAGTIEVDGMAAQAYLADIAFTVSEDAVVRATMWNAELVITEWSGVPGTPVRGYLEGPLYTGGP